MLSIIPLKFDSDNLGCTVGKLDIDENCSLSKIESNLLHGYDLITACVPFDTHLKKILENSGFHLISIRSTYSLLLDSKKITCNNNHVEIRSWSRDNQKINSAQIHELAMNIGVTSRFFKDMDISPDSAIKFYETWINNSFKGYADHILLAYVNQELAGLLTLKYEGNIANIDLIGVIPKFQRSGVGTALLANVKSLLFPDYDSLIVVTEAENIQAIRFYSKHGFILDKIELAYHYHTS